MLNLIAHSSLFLELTATIEKTWNGLNNVRPLEMSWSLKSNLNWFKIFPPVGALHFTWLRYFYHTSVPGMLSEKKNNWIQRPIEVTTHEICSEIYVICSNIIPLTRLLTNKVTGLQPKPAMGERKRDANNVNEHDSQNI